MSTEVKKYEISLTIDGKTIIIKIQRPDLKYIENYFQNLAGENNEYIVNYIKEIHSF
jgi:hypothetical protein